MSATEEEAREVVLRHGEGRHPEILTPAELFELTGAVQISAQRRVLDTHGIFYIVRLDKSIRTTWYHVNHPRTTVAGSNEPAWDRI